MARPRTYIPEDIAGELLNYIETTEDPMIAEYCLLEGSPTKDTLYRLAKECTVLSDSIKRCHEKQQIRTVRKAESGEINTTFAIFKLKQKCYGWTDKQEVENTNKNIDLTEEMTKEEKKEEIKRLLEKR